MIHSFTEENYLKAIFQLSKNKQSASTNNIAKSLDTKASSVTDMLKKLKDKKLVNYEKYKGVTLTKDGERVALNLVRKHRLWETFLVNKLNFEWHQVHDMAEELEHIDSDELVNRLDEFLEHPKFDPHGDPIPDINLNIEAKTDNQKLLDIQVNQEAQVVGVSNTNDDFLQYLSDLKITLGSKLKCAQKFDFDNTLQVIVNKKEIMLSEKVTQSIIIKII